eukprot:scaffold7147_cov130-Isochrysis_galbana.AAC.5
MGTRDSTHLGAEEGECGGHGRVLVLERELAGVGVRLDHRAGHQPALGRVGLGGLQDDVGLNVLGHRREPLSNRHLRDGAGLRCGAGSWGAHELVAAAAHAIGVL